MNIMYKRLLLSYTFIVFIWPAISLADEPILPKNDPSPQLGQALTAPKTIPTDLAHKQRYQLRVPATNTGNWSIDANNRQQVRAFYNSVYLASLNTPINWTGNHSSCTAGITSSEFKDAVLARINYFRAMAGVPSTITFDSTLSAKAQQAALMMSANNALSHHPPNTWNCYTAEGNEAAGSSNLSIGHNAWNAVAGQMRDNGSNNAAVGHRRWLLLPQTQSMGTGDVPAVGSYREANAVWIIDDHYFDTPPDVRDSFIAWPTKGFNPYPIVPIRWSLTYPNADFSNATVTVTEEGNTVPVSIDSRQEGPSASVVWRINHMSADSDWPQPTTDTHYQVSINNVSINGSTASFNYPVTVIDPQTALAAESVATINGDASPSAGISANYDIIPTSLAENHEVIIAEVVTNNAYYNADNGNTINDLTDASYTSIYSGNGDNGTAVYRLAPATLSESIEFPLQFIPTANSRLEFDSKLGFATEEQTAAIQISTDNGSSWKDLYTKTGTGSLTESNFSSHSLSLSDYTNQFVKFRAVYRHTGYRYTGTDANVSFLVDNLHLTNAKKVDTSSTQNIDSANRFSFTPTDNKQYALAARAIPWTGYSGLDWGPIFDITPDSSNTGNEPPSVETRFSEGNSNHVKHFLLQLSKPLGVDASVQYRTEDIDAKSGEDYKFVAGEATIRAGETYTLIGVEIIADQEPESDESFRLIIDNPTGATFPNNVTELSVIRTIEDDDSSVTRAKNNHQRRAYRKSFTPAQGLNLQ